MEEAEAQMLGLPEGTDHLFRAMPSPGCQPGPTSGRIPNPDLAPVASKAADLYRQALEVLSAVLHGENRLLGRACHLAARSSLLAAKMAIDVYCKSVAVLKYLYGRSGSMQVAYEELELYDSWRLMSAVAGRVVSSKAASFDARWFQWIVEAEGHRYADPVTAFPFEGCRQMIDRKQSYQAVLESYVEQEQSAEMCYKIVLINTTLCDIGNKYPNNETRCCNTDFNKLKFWPNQDCRGAITRVTYQRKSDPEPVMRSWNQQIMPPQTVASFTKSWMFQTEKNPANKQFEPQWVYKVENLQWTREDADEARICIRIGGPCPTMKKFAYNGKELEWLLYDLKADNYECCVPGVTEVVTVSEFHVNTSLPCPSPWVVDYTEVCHVEPLTVLPNFGSAR
eukprot:gene30445-35455_t